MRVGLVCPYSLDTPGGVQNHVLGLAEAMRERGHRVSVLASAAALGRSAGTGVVHAGSSVAVPYNGSVARVTWGPGADARVARWLELGRFDVVHVHEPMAPSLSRLTLRHVRGEAVVATYHTAHERTRPLRLAGVMAAGLLDRVHTHVAVSATAAETVGAYRSVNAHIVPNGLRVSDFAPPGPSGRGEEPGRGHTAERLRTPGQVLFLGRADEARKGLHRLLRAWPTVLGLRPEARLVVAGPGRAPRPVPPGVEILGPVDDSDRRRLLATCAVLVAPHTHGESFGMVLVEAMAAGAPILASDLPAFADVLDNGRLGRLSTRRAEPAAFGRDLAGLLADAAVRERLAGAASEAVQRYDWAVVAGEIETLYGRLLGARNDGALAYSGRVGQGRFERPGKTLAARSATTKRSPQ